MTDIYGFTRDQLTNLLYGTIGMLIEYRDVHGKTEENARFAAVGEMFEGLDSEIDLAKDGEVAKLTLSLGEVITVKDHDRVLVQMNGIVEQTRKERNAHKVEGQALREACEAALEFIFKEHARRLWNEHYSMDSELANQHAKEHPLEVEIMLREALKVGQS